MKTTFFGVKCCYITIFDASESLSYKLRPPSYKLVNNPHLLQLYPLVNPTVSRIINLSVYIAINTNQLQIPIFSFFPWLSQTGFPLLNGDLTRTTIALRRLTPLRSLDPMLREEVLLSAPEAHDVVITYPIWNIFHGISMGY